MESIDQRMQSLIAEHLIFGSPTLFALLLPPAIALLIKHASSHVMRKLRRDVSRRFADPVSAIALQVGAEMA